MTQGANITVAHVSVSIAGRSYRMACEAGDEARIEELAAKVDMRIGELREAFGAIDDLRLTVMAAFSMADDLAETERRFAAQEEALNALRAQLAEEKARADSQEAQFAQAINDAAERVENITSDLTPTVQA